MSQLLNQKTSHQHIFTSIQEAKDVLGAAVMDSEGETRRNVAISYLKKNGETEWLRTNRYIQTAGYVSHKDKYRKYYKKNLEFVNR